MTEKEARQLLEAAKKSTERAEKSRAQANADSAQRRADVQACVDAGIPKTEIATALGIARNTVYQILKAF